MNYIVDKIKKIDFVKFFTIIVLFSGLLFLIRLIITDGSFFSELEEMYEYKQDVMFDHTVSMVWGSRNGDLYFNKSNVYPPFANVIYHILYVINPIKVKSLHDGVELRSYFSNYHTIIQIVMTYMLIAIFTSFVIRKYLKLNNIWDGLLLPFAIFTSYIYFLITLVCGNSVILVTAITALSLYYIFYDRSDNERILGIILLAVAFGYKIYPAIFSLEFLRKKQFLRFIEFGVLCICLTILPVQLFGGFEGLIHFVQNILSFNTDIPPLPCCIANKMIYLFGLLGIDINNSFSIQFIRTIFVFIMLFFYFISEKRYQRVLFLMAICIHYVAYSHPYSMTFYLPILLIFMKDNKDKNFFGVDIFDLIIFILITLMYSYFFIFGGPDFYLNFSYIIILAAIVDAIYSKINKLNMNKLINIS